MKSEFYKCVKRRKGKLENIPAIEDSNGTIISDAIKATNILYSYYASVFSCNRNIPNIKSVDSDETFIINTKIIRKRLQQSGEGSQ